MKIQPFPPSPIDKIDDFLANEQNNVGIRIKSTRYVEI